MSTALQPMNDFVVIQPHPVPTYQEYKKLEHIIIPELYEHGPEDRAVWGTLLAKGPACKSPVPVGSTVVIGKWGFAKVTYQDQEYYIVKEGDLLGYADGVAQEARPVRGVRAEAAQ